MQMKAPQPPATPEELQDLIKATGVPQEVIRETLSVKGFDLSDWSQWTHHLDSAESLKHPLVRGILEIHEDIVSLANEFSPLISKGSLDLTPEHIENPLVWVAVGRAMMSVSLADDVLMEDLMPHITAPPNIRPMTCRLRAVKAGLGLNWPDLALVCGVTGGANRALSMETPPAGQLRDRARAISHTKHMLSGKCVDHKSMKVAMIRLGQLADDFIDAADVAAELGQPVETDQSWPTQVQQTAGVWATQID